MNRRVFFRPEAETEINSAADWYEGQGRGLTAEFLRIVDACVESIRRDPELFPVVYGEARRAILRRFPYSIIYIVRDEEILIIACFHASRNPESWQDRL